MGLQNLIKQLITICAAPVMLIKLLFSRQFYYTFIEATLLFVLLLAGLAKPFPSVSRITWSMIFLIYFLPFSIYVFDIQRQKRQRISENRGTGGYLRWDGIYEIHIGDVRSPREFQEKMIKAFLYCRDRELLVEFITANRSYERLLREFGDAIIDIKALGQYSKIILRCSGKKGTVVTASNHPIKVLLNPNLLRFETLPSGRYVLRGNKVLSD